MSGFWARVPLRTQLLVAVLALAAVAVAATAAAGTAALRGYLLDRVDDQLAEAVGPRGGPGGPRLGELGLYYAVRYDPAGNPVLLRGVVREGTSPPRWPRLTPVAAAERSGHPFTVGSEEGGRSWRVLVDARGPVALAVAVPLDDLTDTVRRLIWIDVVVGVVALLTLAGLAWLAVRSSLRPLVQVERTAEAIAAGDLSRRVPPADERTEVGRLAASLNVMLGRIEHAFAVQRESERSARASEERMRRFVADASHELRTPLTSIRGFAELFRQGAVDPAELTRVMRRMEDEAARMGVLVEDLLLLARLDEQRPLEHAPVDLLALAADAVHDARVVGREHEVVLHAAACDDPPVVLGDETRLRQVVANLVGNALAHTPPGTRVEVSVAASDGWATLEVRDDGPGMPPEVADRVFERFYRADESRTRSGSAHPSPGGGSGLGLSIVAALVAAHGGTVTVDSVPGRGTAFTVALPLAGSAAATHSTS